LIYVVETEVGQRFLLAREVCGRAKFNMIRTITRSFVDLFFEQLRTNDLSQYLILRGAYPFDLQFAMGNVPPYDTKLLPTSWIKLQRVLNSEGTDWEIKAQNLIGAYQGNVWLIPDTAIASGSTIAFFLRNGFAHHRPKQVYVFTACGSLEEFKGFIRNVKRKTLNLSPSSLNVSSRFQEREPPRTPPTDLSMMTPGSITTKALYERP
jgi:hypothetical protein